MPTNFGNEEGLLIKKLEEEYDGQKKEEEDQRAVEGASDCVDKLFKEKEDARVVRGHSSIEHISNNLLGNVVVQSGPLNSSLPCQYPYLFSSQNFHSNNVIPDVLGECFAGNVVCSDTLGDGIFPVQKSIQST